MGKQSSERDKGEGAVDKIKGRAREATGSVTGDEDKKAEGRAHQRAAAAAEEAGQKERTRQEQAKAKQAERERDRQERKGKGPLGGITDTLTGR